MHEKPDRGSTWARLVPMASTHPEVLHRGDVALAARGRPAAIGFLLAGGVVPVASAVHARHLPHFLVTGLLLTVLGAVRFMVSRNIPTDGRRSEVWFRVYVLASLTMSAVWSELVAWTLTIYGTAPQGLLMLVANAGIAAASLVSLSPSRTVRVPQAYLTIVLLPSLPPMLAHGTPEARGAATMILFYYTLLMAFATVLHKDYWKGLDNLRLAQEHARALDRAREVAEAASRTKSEFVANVSHEIRTPMNGVLGVTEMLMETPLDASQQELARMIQGSAESLLGIINDILDHAKLESGRFTLERVGCDLLQMSNDIAMLLQPIAEAKHLTLTVECDSAPPRVLGDPVRLRQVITNLVGNAVKFTESGGIRIRLTSLPAEADGTRVRVEVIDTGIGIPPDQQARVFESYTQADGSHSRRFGGTGLGLTISRRLVEMMGGTLSVASEPGRGSTFWFIIPFELAPAAAPDAARPHRVALGRWKGRRALLAEDNAVNRRVAMAQLARLGLDVVAVGDGRHAAESVLGNDYDIVFMDVQMPEMDGLEATGEIRRRQADRPRVPIVALTAHAMPEDRERCLAAGMDDYIMKPLRPEELERVLDRWIDPAQVEHEDEDDGISQAA